MFKMKFRNRIKIQGKGKAIDMVSVMVLVLIAIALQVDFCSSTRLQANARHSHVKSKRAGAAAKAKATTTTKAKELPAPAPVTAPPVVDTPILESVAPIVAPAAAIPTTTEAAPEIVSSASTSAAQLPVASTETEDAGQKNVEEDQPSNSFLFNTNTGSSGLPDSTSTPTFEGLELNEAEIALAQTLYLMIRPQLRLAVDQKMSEVVKEFIRMSQPHRGPGQGYMHGNGNGRPMPHQNRFQPHGQGGQGPMNGQRNRGRYPLKTGNSNAYATNRLPSGDRIGGNNNNYNNRQHFPKPNQNQNYPGRHGRRRGPHTKK